MPPHPTHAVSWTLHSVSSEPSANQGTLSFWSQTTVVAQRPTIPPTLSHSHRIPTVTGYRAPIVTGSRESALSLVSFLHLWRELWYSQTSCLPREVHHYLPSCRKCRQGNISWLTIQGQYFLILKLDKDKKTIDQYLSGTLLNKMLTNQIQLYIKRII